jgi:hypothetical protein
MTLIDRRNMLSIVLRAGGAVAVALTVMPIAARATPLAVGTAGTASPENAPESLVEEAQVVVVGPRRRRRVCWWSRGRRVCAWR